jgi:hypothetical protein
VEHCQNICGKGNGSAMGETYSGATGPPVNLHTPIQCYFFYFWIGAEWNPVHYYCGHSLAYSTNPGW